VRAHQRVHARVQAAGSSAAARGHPHELPEAERVCPHNGSALKEIGVDASEQLNLVPLQMRVIRHDGVKYAWPVL
jgi:transposase